MNTFNLNVGTKKLLSSQFSLNRMAAGQKTYPDTKVMKRQMGKFYLYCILAIGVGFGQYTKEGIGVESSMIVSFWYMIIYIK